MNTDIPSDIADKFRTKYDWLKREQFPSIGDSDANGIRQFADGSWTCHYGNTANPDWCGCTIVVRSCDAEPREVHGKICERWLQEGGASGWLGLPVSDEQIFEDDGDPLDRISHFENGDIICTSKTVSTRIVNIKDRARWYKFKHDQLLDLLRRAVEAPAPERHNEALKAVEDKCKEDQFDVVFLGEFQSGKSTTLDILCGGREISPQGSGTTPTSSVPVSIEALQSNESEEWAEIKFKEKKVLASEIFSTFEGEILDPESNHPLKQFVSGKEGSARDRFCAAFDFDNPDHLRAAQSSLEEAWALYLESDESKRRFKTRQRQLMEVSTLLVRFYNSRERLEMSGKERCPISEVRGYVWFPSDWQENASQGFSYDIAFDDARFAFVEKVILHIDSHFAQQLGCRVTDCPGLDASAYDKEVTRRALSRADGVLFFHQCKKAIGASELGAMFEFVEDTGRTSKTVLALNLWGIPCGKALDGYLDHNGRHKIGIVPGCKQQLEKESYRFPVIWCHALLAYLSAIAERKLRHGDPFSAHERCWLYEKAGKEGDLPEDWSDERLWLDALREINHLFKVPELGTIVALDAAAVQSVWKASNFDELLGAMKETVLREKSGSILIDNGSKKALETLKSHEWELQLKVKAAAQDESKSSEEVAAAKCELKRFDNDVDKALKDSAFVSKQEDSVALLARDLVDNTLVDRFYEGLSRKIAKTVRDLNKNGTGYSGKGFRRALRNEVGPLIAQFFAERGVKTFHNWSDNPTGRWKIFIMDASRLDDEIQELGARHFDGKRLFDNLRRPTLSTKSIDVSEIPERIQDALGGLEKVAEELREGFFSDLLNIILWLPNKIREWFFGSDSEEELNEYANKIRPTLEESFRDENVRRILERGLRAVFAETYREILQSLEKSRTGYRAKIQARCDEYLEVHRLKDDEKHRITEENRMLCEGCIAPLRAEVETFEHSVLTAMP